MDLEVFTKQRETIDLDNLKEYVIVSMPLLMSESESSIVEACAWFEEKKPTTKIVIIALMSSLAVFAELKASCPNILHFINILCIANKQRFTKNITDNYLDEESNPFFDLLFLHAKLFKRTAKALKK